MQRIKLKKIIQPLGMKIYKTEYKVLLIAMLYEIECREENNY